MNKLKPHYEFDYLTKMTVAALLAVLAFYPLFWVIYTSFREALFDPTLTLAGYQEAYSDPRFFSTLYNTFLFCTFGSLLALLMGSFLAWVVGRTDVPMRRLFTGLGILPFITTPLINAIAWSFLLWPRSGLLNGLIRDLFNLTIETGPFNISSIYGMIWVFGISFSPYAFLITLGAFRSMDPSLEEAARISGASWRNTLTSITFPVLSPSILSAWLLIFVLAAGQFGLPAVLGTPQAIYVLTSTIYQKSNIFPVQYGQAASLAMSLMAITVFFTWLRRYILGSKSYVAITGKGYKPEIIKTGKLKTPLTIFCILYLLFSIVLPFLILIYASLISYWSPKLTYNFSLKNYYAIIIEYPITWSAIKNSLVYSSSSALIALFIAFIVSYIIVRTRWQGRSFLEYASMVPISVPAIVFALGIFAAYVRPPFSLHGTVWILALGYISIYLPFGMRSCTGALTQVHEELEESARISGASWFRSSKDIVIPLISQSLLSGYILLFVTMLRELSASIMLYSPRTIVAGVALFDIWEEGNFPALAAFSVVLLIIAGAVIGLLFKFVKAEMVQS